MSIDAKKTCSTHTKEKEESGICCQVEEKERAEQQTYEQSFVTIERHTAGNKLKEQNE